MPDLSRLIYISTAQPDLSFLKIQAILDVARSRNEPADVTGMLLYDGTSFMQLLEGPETAVERIFSSIARDKRHSGVVRIHSETGVEREFSDWSMGYSLIEDPRAPSGGKWFPLTNELLRKNLPETLSPLVHSLFVSFLSVPRAAE